MSNFFRCQLCAQGGSYHISEGASSLDQGHLERICARTKSSKAHSWVRRQFSFNGRGFEKSEALYPFLKRNLGSTLDSVKGSGASRLDSVG